MLALAGVEGLYIRVAAPDQPSSAGGSGMFETPDTSSNNLQQQREKYPHVRDLHLILNIENADRSAASQIALLLPICESAIRVREFIKVYSRYEYGKVSHALVAGMKGILREFDLLIAQVEDELFFTF